jgi:hypothetical protein
VAMAKFSGDIGFVITTETADGVWQEQKTELHYTGDVIRDSRSWETPDKVTGDIVIRNKISIIGNAFAFGNVSAMRYVVWMNVKWKISNIEVEPPRLILNLGGVYNG